MAAGFWSWCDQMFQLMAELTPDDVFDISRFAFVELAMHGVSAVGFGVFKDKVISNDQVSQLQHNILVSHAVGVSETFDSATTRAMMLIRDNTLSRGHSGIRLATLQLLLDLLNAGVHPIYSAKRLVGGKW
jgi:histidine ammonia-lyase